MLIKLFIIAVIIAIVASLASGLFYLVKDKGQTDRTAKALTIRIALSVSLFALLMLGIFTGHIKPHGLYSPNHQVNQAANN
ncbi:MAG: twin transmembrane helix small protein [Gammaproteobacteria bacterium]